MLFSTFQSFLLGVRVQYTCCKLWTEICEIRQIFKGNLIKFSEIFTKIILDLHQNSQKPLSKCKKLVINTTKCYLYLFLHKCVVRWSENSLRYEKSYGNWLPDGPNSLLSHSARYGMYGLEIIRLCRFQADLSLC